MIDGFCTSSRTRNGTTREAEIACRDSARILPELLRPALGDPPLDTLGRCARVRLCAAPMGADLADECAGEERDLRHLPLSERDDLYHPGAGRCNPASRSGTLPRR